MALDVRMGDVIEMRKAHPCGDRVWTVVRVGADIGLRCHGCDRRILMDRPTLHRRAKQLLERGEAVDPAIEAALFGSEAPSVDQVAGGVRHSLTARTDDSYTSIAAGQGDPPRSDA